MAGGGNGGVDIAYLRNVSDVVAAGLAKDGALGGGGGWRMVLLSLSKRIMGLWLGRGCC